ncbi:MAG: hypothetical protein K2Y32_18175 [Candidatus Obscuribacterales bacterium]|nr:hypothetical protein [Candidatus Obscuribacterales bacterium]
MKASEKPRSNGSKKAGSRSRIALAYVRRYLSTLPAEAIFTTRELLPLVQYRNTLDSFLSRSVNCGKFERLAYGVFRVRRLRNLAVTEERLAGIKRSAFAAPVRTTDSSRQQCKAESLAFAFGDDLLTERSVDLITGASQSSFEFEQILAPAARRTGWRLRKGRIKSRPLGNRKILLGETEAGRALLGLWLKGMRMKKVAKSDDQALLLGGVTNGNTDTQERKVRDCTREDVMAVWKVLDRREKLLVPALRQYLPQWLSEMLPAASSESLNLLCKRISLRKDGKRESYKKPGNRQLV